MEKRTVFQRVIEREREEGGEFICNDKGEVPGDYTFKLPHRKLRAYAFLMNFTMTHDANIPAGECRNMRNMN